MIKKIGYNDIKDVISILKPLEYEQSTTFGLITPVKNVLEKNLISLSRFNIRSPITIGYVYSENSSHNSQKYQIMDNTQFFYDTELADLEEKSKIIANELKKNTKQDYRKLAKKLIINGTGAFTFIIIGKDYLVLGKDPLGIQPFYYGQNESHFIFASNRRIFWKLKINNPKFFPPGNICIANNSEIKFISVKKFKIGYAKSINLNASNILLRLLNNSIRKHLKGINSCAVAFSGGLDSSLIAFLTKKYVKDIQLIHVSLAENPEIEEAKKAAKILDLPIEIFSYLETDVQETLSKVLKIIEEPTPLKASIGIPFYWVAQKTKKIGFDVLLAGQGADELFGGYKKYLDLYLSNGNEKATKKMFNDILQMHENNLARDMKICNYHGIALCCPFLSTKLVDFALKLPIELKMEKNPNSLRKLILRKVCYNIGLPSIIVEKPKKAIQYSTGVNRTLIKLAKNNKIKLSKYIENKFSN
ncbi:hypothetical protein E2P47_02715 [Candidatus Bathyarchaeota archaeon]|nr:hypothetical protein E2P47_02715 [Candidatus Bathyarchaeota archaeon]